MFTLIFDTHGGLCNQMYDIYYAINFCMIYDIPFSFRFASLRCNDNLTQWYNVPFNELFDDTIFKFITLYKPFSSLQIPEEELFCEDSKRCVEWLDKDRALYPQLDRLEKPYIVLRQFWAICPPIIHEKCNIYANIMPCNRLLNLYTDIGKYLPNEYNLIHYRYEPDFIEHFKLNTIPLCSILDTHKFKNPTLPTYIAAYNIEYLSGEHLSKPLSQFSHCVYKPKHISDTLNFEEGAFIDFMIGRNAKEVVGHHNSSFSVLLNNAHMTNNYYDM